MSKVRKESAGLFGFPPWLLGRACIQLWRLTREGSQVGVTLELSNDADRNCGWPKVFVKWAGDKMTLFSQESPDDRPVRHKEWKVKK